MLNEWLIATWNVIVASSPWLLFGFFFAGILHVLLPAGFIERQLQVPGVKSVLKASAFGIPLPLCSCSVIPVGISLRRQGASRGATASFGAQLTFRAAKKMESLGRDGDLEGARNGLGWLEDEVHRLQDALSEFVKSTAGCVPGNDESVVSGASAGSGL